MKTWDIPKLEIEPHKPEVLLTEAAARAIAINLPAGEELQEHEVHEHTYLFVAAGEVEVGQGSEQVTGAAGLVAHFAPGERHTVRARSDARLMLLLAPWPGEGHPSQR